MLKSYTDCLDYIVETYDTIYCCAVTPLFPASFPTHLTYFYKFSLHNNLIVLYLISWAAVIRNSVIQSSKISHKRTAKAAINTVFCKFQKYSNAQRSEHIKNINMNDQNKPFSLRSDTSYSPP